MNTRLAFCIELCVEPTASSLHIPWQKTIWQTTRQYNYLQWSRQITVYKMEEIGEKFKITENPENGKEIGVCSFQQISLVQHDLWAPLYREH